MTEKNEVKSDPKKKGVTIVGGVNRTETQVIGGKLPRGKGVKFLGTGEERNRLMNHEDK